MGDYTYLDTYSWSPQISILNIIEQIKDIAKEKQLVYKKHQVDLIKYQYLNADIDIDSWLY